MRGTPNHPDYSTLSRDVERLQRRIMELESRQMREPIRLGRPGKSVATTIAWGWVSDVHDAGPNRWEYEWEMLALVLADESKELLADRYRFQVVGPGPGRLLNILEWYNTDEGMLGIGLTAEYLSDSSCPFALQPIPTNVPLPIWTETADDGTVIYITSYTNAVKGQS